MGAANVGMPVAAGDGEPARRSGSAGDTGPAETVQSVHLPAGHVRQRSQRGARPSRLGSEQAKTARSAVGVLADRLAAALVHHEPGWRLPRHSALARRYNVSAAEIDAAIEELVARHLVRRLADGQVYRASPAEYVIDLEGVSGLATRLDAMGAEFACRSRQLSWRLPPEDISWALRMSAEQQVCVVRYLWTTDGAPAALLTTYVPGGIAAEADAGATAASPSVVNLFQLTGVRDAAGAATAVHLELQAPPPSVARSLRLGAGQPAMILTIRFDDVAAGRPIALTIAVLRPEMFRLVLQTPLQSQPDGDAGNLAGSWTHAIEDWEP